MKLEEEIVKHAEHLEKLKKKLAEAKKIGRPFKDRADKVAHKITLGFTEEEYEIFRKHKDIQGFPSNSSALKRLLSYSFKLFG